MQAVLQDRYGPPEVLYIADVEKPAPRDDQVLIRIRASIVSQTDTHARAAHPFFWRLIAGFRRPTRWRSLGVELAGEIEAVGAGVSEFKAGDRVFGGPLVFGAHAQYICLSEKAALATMPEGMDFDEAAAVIDGAAQALATLRKADVQAGQRIVVYGASGSLGTAAVQIAKHMGVHVTGVCGTGHSELVRSLGADEVVDYRHEDFSRERDAYDAIIDAVGKGSFRRFRRALKPRGVYVATDGLRNFFWWSWTRFVGTRRLTFASGRRKKEDVLFMKGLIESGAYRPVIDRRYPMEQVAEAHRYVEAWHKAGNVVLTIS